MADDTPHPNLARNMERYADREIGILFDEHEAHGRFNEQEQCPLFSVLPRELRDLVWEYALAPFEDQTRPFAAIEYYYRPGHTARLKTDTSLLRTCRRVWLEANQMPMLQAEHSFYYHRAAPDACSPEWMVKLTDHNRLNFGHLHLYVQMCAIEGLTANPGALRQYFLKTHPKPGDFQPRMLHVTLRHTDWWYWENETRLRLEDSWVQAMLDSPDLRSTQTFKLELETLDYKLVQLKPILERLRKLESKEFETHIIDGKPATTKFVLCPLEEEYTWCGPTNIDKQIFQPYAGKSDLKYHVTTLTWKLKFPSIPTAFIPEMRRAPRIPMGHLTQIRRPRTRQDEFALPYSDPGYHSRAMRKWRMRTRVSDLRRRRWPTAGEEQFFLLSAGNAAVQHVTTLQADDVEEHRRKLFRRQTDHLLPTRWKAQRSLLKFLPPEQDEVEI